MKAVILAGGFGTRLAPLTQAINKHLLPVGREPMIYHPIKKCVEAGIDEILVVTGGDCADGFLTLLKDGSHLGVRQLYYAHQVGAGGIAEALKLGQSFVGNDVFAVLLGDNIFTDSLKPHVDSYLERVNPRTKAKTDYAQIHLTEVRDPERFGCPVFNEDGQITEIIEKPKPAPSNYAVVGIYFYPPTIFEDVLPKLSPSGRGELEITDVNNHFLRSGKLAYRKLHGKWSDAGTWPSWEEANQILK